MRVHLAAMREQEIRASNDLAVSRAALNDALGVSLDRAFELTTPLESDAAAPEATLEDYRRLAAEHRPEMRQAELAQSLARTQQQIAGSAYWPQVAFQGIVEADRQNFRSNGGANWFTAVTLRWNLWNGGETKARVEQARFAESRAEALRKRADSAIQLGGAQGVPGCEGRCAAGRGRFGCRSRGARGAPHHPEPPPGRPDDRHRAAAERDCAGRRPDAAPGGHL